MTGGAAAQGLAANEAWMVVAVCAAGAAFAWWFRQRRPALALALLGWLALGLGGAGLVEDSPGIGPATIVAAWLPWDLLLFAALSWSPGIGWAVAWLILLAAQYPVGQWLGIDPARISAYLSSWAPEPVGSWLTPLEPALLALATVLFFVRWQRRSRTSELALCLTGSLMLLAALRPDCTFAALLGSAGLLLTGVVHATHRMAFIDPLTGLPNRRALNAALANPARHLALAMLDIDHFKRINDRHGHDFGDQVLKMVAARIRRHRRCRAFRYGGEEFCLLFRTTKPALARRWCEEIRTEVGGRPIVPRGPRRPARRPLNKGRYRRKAPQLKVTVSVGLALAGGRLDGVEALLEAADKALYRAKRGGRDRVSVARR